MNLIRSCGCGISTMHPIKNFHRNYHGSAFYLLMCFNTDFVYYKDGKIERGKKFQCVLNTPNVPIVHGPANDMHTGFENDWIFFTGEEIPELIESLDLPLNTAFSVSKNNCLTAYINAILQERKGLLPYSEIYISNIIREMLLHIARNRKVDEHASSKAYDTITGVRANMLKNYMENYDLKRLSEESGYSVSRFCELYKLYYDSSPITDLINIRLSKAKYYLLFTDYTVSEIATLCGFESIHYFSNMFKKNVKCSPKQYRCNADAHLGSWEHKTNN